MDVDALSVNISKAFDELRNLDDTISALAGRERFGGIRRRISDGGPPRMNNFQAADRREVRTVSVGGMGSVNKRRLLVSADNDLYEGVSEKRARGRDEERVDDSRRRVQSSIVMPTIETKSREAAISELKGTQKKEVSTRNRRMFSNLLLGTLQRFQKDEKKVLSTEKVQADKQLEVERRLRATEVEEKERLAKERQDLFEQRREKERLIKALQRKKAIIQYAEQKQDHYRKLQGFIQTQAKPPLFYLPAKHTLITLELLKTSAKKIDGLIERRKQQMESDLKTPEERAREAETSNGQDIDAEEHGTEPAEVSSTAKSSVKKVTKGETNGDVEEEEEMEQEEKEDEKNEEADKDQENDGSKSGEMDEKNEEEAVENENSRSSDGNEKDTDEKETDEANVEAKAEVMDIKTESESGSDNDEAESSSDDEDESEEGNSDGKSNDDQDEEEENEEADNGTETKGSGKNETEQ